MTTAMPQTPTELLTVAEAAQLLGLSPSTVYSAVHRGTIPAVQLTGRGGAIRISRRKLDAILNPPNESDE